MKAIPFDVGRVVLSKQGHDKGRYFAVVGLVDEKYVLIADGETRRLEKPKRKQTKHLRAKPITLVEIGAALVEGRSVLDSDVRKALRALSHEEGNHGMRECQKKEECALVQE